MHGKLAGWYLRNDQLPLYELLLREKNPFLECARRYGKTTTILCYVIERLLANPAWVAMWCEPDKNQAREIVKPEIEKLFLMAPRSIRPKWESTDSYYTFPNGSKLKLRGVNHDRGDSARGSFAHIIVADEFGTWKDPDYIVDSALRPQLQTTNGAFVFASTPPEDLGHPYYTHKAKAIRHNRFIQRTIHDNEAITPERMKELIEENGGVESVSWKREYLCEEISDPERLVIPEYREDSMTVPDDYPRPAHFDSYVGLDLGFNDNTAVLFAYYDFLKDELVIDNEMVVSGKNSLEITNEAKAIEASLWGDKAPYRRVSDNDLQQIYDMLTLCNYPVTATRKDDKLAAINALRLRFGQNKLKIKARCKNLHYQLKVGLWNDRRTDFQRGEFTGHLDAVAALIYLHRNLDLSRNPYPQNVGIHQNTHWINPDQLASSQGNTALKEALKPLGRR